MAMKKVPWVDHVEEVELGVDRDRGLLPRCVRGRPFLDHHLLCKYQSSKDISHLETEYRVDDVVEELVGEGKKGDACKDGHRCPQQRVNKFTAWTAGGVVALRHVKLFHTVVALEHESLLTFAMDFIKAYLVSL